MPPSAALQMATRFASSTSSARCVQRDPWQLDSPRRRVAAEGNLARHTANGYTGTSLVPDTLTDIGGGACFNDARVECSKVADEAEPEA
jgi:hypothetical protein